MIIGDGSPLDVEVTRLPSADGGAVEAGRLNLQRLGRGGSA